jgi:hypothetical protein
LKLELRKENKKMARYYTQEERALIPQQLIGDMHSLNARKKELTKLISKKRAEIRKALKQVNVKGIRK